MDKLAAVHKEPGKLMHLCDYGGEDIMALGEISGWSLKDVELEQMD